MDIAISRNSVIVFDLDDTLYSEVDFVLSGFRAVADFLNSRGFPDYEHELVTLFRADRKRVLDRLIESAPLPATLREDLIRVYGEHLPDLSLSKDVKLLLESLRAQGFPLALITDGPSVRQRNKLRALGIEAHFDPIVISEEIGSSKPHRNNYERVQNRHPGHQYLYIADNPAKDFVTPNQLGWRTIGVRATERNIHSQTGAWEPEYLPQIFIDNLGEVRFVVGS